MVNFGNCVDWVLRLEDRRLSGVVANLSDGEGRTRFGIAERSHPDLNKSFYDVDRDTALFIAKDIYWREYWTPICGPTLPTDEFAATLLSFAVNDGVSRAVKILQEILQVKVDGDLGSRTRAALLTWEPADLTERLREAQETFYEDLAASHPENEVFVAGWVHRARARYPDLPA